MGPNHFFKIVLNSEIFGVLLLGVSINSDIFYFINSSFQFLNFRHVSRETYLKSFLVLLMVME